MDANVRPGAEALVQGLVSAGVEHVFGLPGDTGVDLYDAFFRATPWIRHVMCRDERHAVIMADVYARSRNRLGVVEVSSGGGVTYCIGGLGEAFASSSPLLVISSDIHTESRNTGALTELDQEGLFGSVTKWVRRAERADDIPSLLAEAISVATTDRPAPVAIIVPENLLAEPTAAAAVRLDTAVPARRRQADAASVKAVAASLLAARRPAIFAGGGVHLSGAYEELALLAEIARAPIATSIHGKGCYPESGPWSLGVAGANGGRDYANAYLASADFVLFVGTRANATDTNGFRCPPRDTAVAQIDIEPARAGRNFPHAIPLVADAKRALAALAAAIGGRVGRGSDPRLQIDEQREAWRRIEPEPVPQGTVHPLTVLRLLRKRYGADALVVADCGTATPFLAAHWETESVGRRLLVARGHGPMGYAIPGAVGAALANPGRAILALTTDGSLAMSCGELETAARLALPITFVQLTNGTFGWIKMLQHLYHDGRYFGVDLGPVDACAVAAGFGVPATRVDSEGALHEALASLPTGVSGPFYIDVAVADTVDLELPVAPWTEALAGVDVVRPVY